MKNATIKLILGNKPLSNGNYNIYLRITKNRKKKEISLGIQSKRIDFENELLVKSHPQHIEYNHLLSKLKTRAYDIIREYRLSNYDFTLQEFENNFRGEKDNEDVDAYDFFDEIIEEMKKSNRLGNARAYKETKDALIKYSKKPLMFSDITPAFLEKFEGFLRGKDNEDGGIAFKMRELRALFNTAIRRGLIGKEHYPFELYKISKLKAKKDNKAISIEEFKRIRDLDLSGHPNLVEAHNYFMFSFYCCGINFKDMMMLKWADIKVGRIHYTRSKTKGQFSIELIDKAIVIIDFYKRQDRQTQYVFPILLNDSLTPQQIENRKHKVEGRCNVRLKIIAQLAKVETHVTFYVARHTFASIHKQIGTDVSKISDFLGHSNVGVTETYLKRHSDDILDKENRKLSNL